jgi:hypothetical protein
MLDHAREIFEGAPELEERARRSYDGDGADDLDALLVADGGRAGLR